MWLARKLLATMFRQRCRGSIVLQRSEGAAVSRGFMCAGWRQLWVRFRGASRAFERVDGFDAMDPSAKVDEMNVVADRNEDPFLPALDFKNLFSGNESREEFRIKAPPLDRESAATRSMDRMDDVRSTSEFEVVSHVELNLRIRG